MSSKPETYQAITAAYVAPFAAFVGIMAVEKVFSISPQWAYPVRFFAVSAMVLTVARHYWTERPSRPFASLCLGAAVFIIWIGPDVLFDYRHSWLFNNALTGASTSSIPVELRTHFWFVLIRTFSCTALVPIVEELFWRGWLMRWLIDQNFMSVPLGKYTPAAFWLVAILFASEHGPYWDVGLITGVIYNWWMVRTRNLGDCILMHAVTNGILSAYVVVTGRWEYLS